jgi:molybdate transport system ATP-binding protein
MPFEVDLAKRIGDADIALSFRSNAPVTALVGASGAGKTTVLNMIAGITRPDRGRVRIGGRVLVDCDEGIDVAPERRRCGYVFQDNRLFPHLTVRRNLLYGYRLAPRDAHWSSPDEVVDLLGLGALQERKPATLSGGEARRVAIGRALLSAPEFLLLDEPLTSLDRERREDILATIEHIRDRFAIPILYVTHHQDEVGRVAGMVVTMPDQASFPRSWSPSSRPASSTPA